MQDKKVTNAQDMGPELWLIHGASWVTEQAICYIVSYIKKYKKVKKHHQRHIHSIGPQANTEKVCVTSWSCPGVGGSTLSLRIPRRSVRGWACPASCDLVTAIVLVGSLSVGPGKQIFGFPF